MLQRSRYLCMAVAAACLLAAPSIAQAGKLRADTLLDVLQPPDGAQALVAAVPVMDGGVLPCELVEVLSDRRADLVVFAPTSAAFAKLLKHVAIFDRVAFRNGSARSSLPVSAGASGIAIHSESTLSCRI